MPGANIYDDPRIAAVYDLENTSRVDTDFYLDLAAELEATTVVDIGCGAGDLSCALAERGHAVVGVDPAGAMIEVARGRPGGQLVEWIVGDTSAIDTSGTDLVIMTGHAAQEIHADESWAMTLDAARRALRPAATSPSKVATQERGRGNAGRRSGRVSASITRP
jgi:SAM-dependent methyltransferase